MRELIINQLFAWGPMPDYSGNEFQFQSDIMKMSDKDLLEMFKDFHEHQILNDKFSRFC